MVSDVEKNKNIFCHNVFIYLIVDKSILLIYIYISLLKGDFT